MIYLRDDKVRRRLVKSLRDLVENLRSRDEFGRLLRDIETEGDLARVDRAERLMLRRGRDEDRKRLSTAIWKGAQHDKKLYRFIEHQFRLLTRTFGGKRMSEVSRSLRGIIPDSRSPRTTVSSNRSMLQVRVAMMYFDIREPPDALEVTIRLPEQAEHATGVRVTLRAEVIRSRLLDTLLGRYEPVMASRTKTFTWSDLYDWSDLLDKLKTAGAAWLRKAYEEAENEAEREAVRVEEGRKRRIQRRLTTSPRRFYGRAKSGTRMGGGRLPKSARPPRRLVRPRVKATNPSKSSELRRWSDFYRVNRGRIKSRGKQMRKLPWYKQYQKQLRKLALSKGTRRR